MCQPGVDHVVPKRDRFPLQHVLYNGYDLTCCLCILCQVRERVMICWCSINGYMVVLLLLLVYSFFFTGVNMTSAYKRCKVLLLNSVGSQRSPRNLSVSFFLFAL